MLTEPIIHEPAAIAWDGNGRMYVIEMRTYMQDIDGKNQLAPTSRVSRHEDTNGDDNDTLDLSSVGPFRIVNETVDADGDSTSAALGPAYLN